MKRWFSLTFFALLVALAGCRSAPIHDIEAEPLGAPELSTLEQVRTGILRAGSYQSWEMTEVEPGHLVGRILVSGKHLAVVDIFFDTEAFSVRYKDSKNLNYNGEAIHPNYNRWIKTLKREIHREMRRITPPALSPAPKDEEQEARIQEPRHSADSENDPASNTSGVLRV